MKKLFFVFVVLYSSTSLGVDQAPLYKSMVKQSSDVYRWSLALDSGEIDRSDYNYLKGGSTDLFSMKIISVCSRVPLTRCDYFIDGSIQKFESNYRIRGIRKQDAEIIIDNVIKAYSSYGHGVEG